MSDFASKMAAARPAERTVELCLRGDLVAQLEDLERQAELAQAGSGNASKEDTGTADLVAQIETLQAEMRESTEVFRLKALSPRKYRLLRDQHPPRRDETGELDTVDAVRGFNRDTLPPELVRACTTRPELTERQWHELLGDTETRAAELEAEGRASEVADGVLSYSQYMNLVNTAWNLNEGDVSVPFSRAALLTSQSSGGE